MALNSCFYISTGEVFCFSVSRTRPLMALRYASQQNSQRPQQDNNESRALRICFIHETSVQYTVSITFENNTV